MTQQEVSTATRLVTNDIDVDFNGFGLSLGIDGERRSPCTGLMVYGRGLSSFLAGDWKGSYVQTNQFEGGVVAKPIRGLSRHAGAWNWSSDLDGGAAADAVVRRWAT